MYKTEESLVNEFVRRLRAKTSPWGHVEVCREFDYSRGRVDILAVSGSHRIVAFEAKLVKWRQALQQAYRNTCFAHSSYVLLPPKTAFRAQKCSADFVIRNVGLCYMTGGKITVILRPENRAPIEPWLSKAALSAVKGRSGSAGNRPRTRRSQVLREAQS